MKITVDVTQEDIAEGCRADGLGRRGGCMVWRAFQRATEGAFPRAHVGSGDIMLDVLDVHTCGPYAKFPEFVADRIEAYDHDMHVEPFAFDIDIPLPV